MADLQKLIRGLTDAQRAELLKRLRYALPIQKPMVLAVRRALA